MSEPRDAIAPPDTKTAKASAGRPRLDKALRVLSKTFGFIGGAGSMLFCMGAGELFGSGFEFLVGIPVGFVLIVVSIVLHECGHYFAAQLLGMHTLSAHVGPLQLMAQRQGFRWRWKRGKRVASGAVFSIPDPNRGFRKQLFWYAAGGPMASLAAALLGCAVGALVADGPWRGFAFAFALLNACLCIGNLVPTTTGLATDGLLMLRAWKRDDSDPSLVLMRLNALAITGTTADQLPKEDVERLGTLAQPLPTFQFWFKLKALQNQLRWKEAAEFAAEFQRLRESLPEPIRTAMAEFTALIDCEIRFSALMAEGADAPSPLDALTAESDWFSPSVRPRCLAAMAAVAGKPEEARHWLQVAESAASDSPDAAHRTSESRIRADIASRLASSAPLPA